MLGNLRNAILPAFMLRFDRWLLLRAPMLWRTGLPDLLVLLGLAVLIAGLIAIPFVHMSIKAPTDVADLASNTTGLWWIEMYAAGMVIYFWVLSLLVATPVGELAPRRHIATVVAVAIGSYLWLVMPSVLAYPQINAIKRIGPPGDRDLTAHLEVVSRYSDWECVPPDVLDNASELEELRFVLVYYGADARDLKKGKRGDRCTSKDSFELESSLSVYRTRKAIEAIREARGFATRGENRFDLIRTGPFRWLAVAFGLGMAAAIMSYPLYVWRRIFLRR